MSPSRRYRAAESIAYEVLDGEAVVLHLPTGTYYKLNEVATRAFEALVTAGTLDPARTGILDEFEVGEEILDADLAELVDDLVGRGLVAEIRP